MTERIGALISQEAIKNKSEIKERVDGYESLYTQGTAEDREKNYMKQVNTYYDLATPFYEYAWGQSFHFASQAKGESYESALARYEHSIALKIRAGPVCIRKSVTFLKYFFPSLFIIHL